MNLNELLEMLDLDEASQFEYFENLADLVESDEDIELEAICQLFKDVDMNTVSNLLETYFDELLESIPEDSTEVYTLMDSIRMALIGMSKNAVEESDIVHFSDEFHRFRTWYSLESEVWIRPIGSIDGDRCITLRDALTLTRVEKLGGESYEYTFDEALNFEMDQYTMSFADLLHDEMEQDQYELDPAMEDFQDRDIPGLEYTDHIFTPDENLN